jgi:hypothetical protein
MFARQAIEGERLADVGLHPFDKLRVLRRPLADPSAKIALRFLDVAPVVKPSEFLQAIVIGLARQVVQSVT